MNQWRMTLLGTAAIIIFVMLGFIVYASSVRHVFDNAHLMGDVWFQTTLVDLYFAFGVFYLWVVSREPSILARVVWLVAIVCLGSLGIGLYLLMSVLKSERDTTLADFLTPKNS